MKYKIGDVAKILGISPDLLRYYEKKGVVKPLKDKANDYRYYETWDINFLIDCLWYKKFGFGIEQISRMVSSCTTEDILRLFTDKETEIREAIRLNELLLGRSTEFREELTRAKQLLGRCDICGSPEIVRYINRYNFIYDNSDELQQLSQQWLKFMPFTHRCFEISADTLLGDGTGDDYQWGFSLDMDYVREFGVEIKPPIIHLASQTSIHSVFESSGKNNFSARHIRYLVDYARENGLELAGGARGNLLCSVVDDGKLTGFFEVWMPIKD